MSQRDTPKTILSRISEEMLNELIDDDATALFHSGALFEDRKQRLAERILNAEMTHHLAQDDQREAGNTRNGHNRKTVLTGSSAIPLEVPRVRHGTFEPQLVEKQCALREIDAIDVSPELIAYGTQ